ncbi:MAG: FG-GAP-like repeat-containing protein, partial [Ignavibacteriales bacterium]
KNGALSSFSNYGANSVDVAAPGEGIYSTLPGNGYGVKNGTSMAAGFVSGEAVLMKNSSDNANASHIRAKVINYCEKFTTLVSKVKKGKIDCDASMMELSNSKLICIQNAMSAEDRVYKNVYNEDISLYGISDYTNLLVSGDFNGDGKKDLAGFYYYGNGVTSIRVWTSNGTEFNYSGDDGWWKSNAGGYIPDYILGRVVSGDFNGDGKDDIVAFYDYGNSLTSIHIWTSTGSGFQNNTYGTWWCSGTGNYNAGWITGRVVSGDFNGDGKDDITAFYDYGNYVINAHTWLSTGEMFQLNAWWSSNSYLASNITGRVVAGDFNEDGKADIAAFYDYGNDLIKIHVWLSTSSIFNFYEWWSTQIIQYIYNLNNQLTQVYKNGTQILEFDYDANGNLISKHQ